MVGLVGRFFLSQHVCGRRAGRFLVGTRSKEFVRDPDITRSLNNLCVHPHSCSGSSSQSTEPWMVDRESRMVLLAHRPHIGETNGLLQLIVRMDAQSVWRMYSVQIPCEIFALVFFYPHLFSCTHCGQIVRGRIHTHTFSPGCFDLPFPRACHVLYKKCMDPSPPTPALAPTQPPSLLEFKSPSTPH